MTLTVRLDDTLESALERYCVATGTTKSLVVQESLAAYLLANPAQTGTKAAPGNASFRAFAEAGLLGSIAVGQGADKAAVRARVADRLSRRKPRQGAA